MSGPGAEDELAQPLDVAPAEAVDAPSTHSAMRVVSRSGLGLAALGAIAFSGKAIIVKLGYRYGTDEPGNGFRETFVVVASESPIDLAELGRRPEDPRFDQSGEPFEPDPYGPEHRDALRIRSRGIVLTDDYAPVDNLLAPVAATRGTE